MLTGLLPSPAGAVVFAAVVFVLNATPGVDFLLTVTRTLQGGARAGIATPNPAAPATGNPAAMPGMPPVRP